MSVVFLKHSNKSYLFFSAIMLELAFSLRTIIIFEFMYMSEAGLGVKASVLLDSCSGKTYYPSDF